jgi:azurin
MVKNKLLETIMKKILLLLCIGFIVGCSSNKDVTIEILPDGNKMAYLTKEFTVKKDQTVTLIMNNTATAEMMKHNVVILNDKSKVNDIGMKALKAPDYLPVDPAIIAATPIADAGEKTSITFTAPSTPGEYIYICTFPGHYAMMQGTMIVK